MRALPGPHLPLHPLAPCFTQEGRPLPLQGLCTISHVTDMAEAFLPLPTAHIRAPAPRPHPSLPPCCRCIHHLKLEAALFLHGTVRPVGHRPFGSFQHRLLQGGGNTHYILRAQRRGAEDTGCCRAGWGAGRAQAPEKEPRMVLGREGIHRLACLLLWGLAQPLQEHLGWVL